MSLSVQSILNIANLKEFETMTCVLYKFVGMTQNHY